MHVAIGEAVYRPKGEYERNSKLSSEETGKAIGRARRTVDSYISDLMSQHHRISWSVVTIKQS